jgi:hypothetical protein
MAHAGGKPRSKKRSEDGAVMLVVMLILLTATALAGISLQATQYELRAAGFDRTATQTQYVSESAMATTLSWIDATSLDGSIMNHIGLWNDGLQPDVSMFGEPVLTPANRQDANRTQWSQQARLTPVTIPPITVTGADNDTIGTFGPKSSYHPGAEVSTTNAALSDYVVDMYDCQRLPGGGTPGSQVNQTGSGTIRVFQLYCVVTSRGRSFLFGPAFTGKTKVWQTATLAPYNVNRFSMAHDSRGTIVSPPIVVQ